jgi:hypothetical protein
MPGLAAPPFGLQTRNPYTRPGPGWQVNRGHPLAKDLRFFSVYGPSPTNADMVTGKVATTGGVTRLMSPGASGISPAAPLTGVLLDGTSSVGWNYGNLPGANITAAITVMVWATDSSSAGEILARDSNTLGRGYTLDTDSVNWRWYLNGGGGGNAPITTAKTPGKMACVIGTYDGSSVVNLYLDGVSKATASGTPAPASTTANLWVGRRDYVGAEGYWLGSVAMAAVWARQLSAREAAWVYAEPYVLAIPPAPAARYTFFLPSTNTTFNQSLAATQTQTPSILKSVGKIVLPTQTQTPTVLKSVGKKVNATETQTSALVRSAGKTISVTQTQTPTVVRSVGKVLGFAQTQTGTVVKRIGKVLTAGETATPLMPKGLARTLNAVQIQAASLIASMIARAAPGGASVSTRRGSVNVRTKR